MPAMTTPLAHLELLASEVRERIRVLDLEAKQIAARIEELQKWRWEVDTVLDEERKKLEGK